MLSPPAELLGVQIPSLLHRPSLVASLDAAVECIELAESSGLLLDESQRFTLSVALGERADGTWAAVDVVDEEPRQNGKGDTMIARQLAGLFLFAEDLQIATAHEFKTANEAFLRLVAVIDGDPSLRAKVLRVRYGNGEQGVELRNGGRLKFLARTGGAGRGFAGVSTVYLDEAYDLTAQQMAAILPTMSTHPNPQRWVASSAPLAHSTVLWGLRKRCLRSNGGAMSGESPDRLAYVGHTAEVLSLDETGRIVSVSPDPADREAWATANPALGWRIPAEYASGELAALGPEVFLRERLGVGDPEPVDVDAKPAKVPAVSWAGCHVDGRVVEVEPGRCVLGVDATPGGGWVSVAIAAGTPSSPYVEVVRHERGTGWVAAAVVELVSIWKPLAVGVDTFGPAGGLLGPLRAGLLDAGVDPASVIRVANTGELKQWCESWLTDVVEGRLRVDHKQSHLDLAVANAAERTVGDGWLWDRRDATVPLSPLVAATIARGLAVELLPEPVAPAFFIY